ncbi:hypothetical protein PR202_gb17713 [Eleusine coracana subsp. coracana]|uniref:Uncharacterized protein n=1 Tax=Eleusine coracana subsp. coracana TaxID=191504 RepID=A0AAV5F3R1_ELECO|nr:hypothetical protein PR202_gb17713 [Eleusine coracana subsp. coracana]
MLQRKVVRDIGRSSVLGRRRQRIQLRDNRGHPNDLALHGRLPPGDDVAREPADARRAVTARERADGAGEVGGGREDPRRRVRGHGTERSKRLLHDAVHDRADPLLLLGGGAERLHDPRPQAPELGAGDGRVGGFDRGVDVVQRREEARPAARRARHGAVGEMWALD